MADKYLEENRFLFIETPLGPNELLLESFTGTEALSRLFSFQLELLSQNPRIAFDGLLGREISFGVAGPEGSEKRFINGIVTSFSQLPPSNRLSRYRAEVSPKIWILTRKARSRVFQHLSVPDILREVLGGFDVSIEAQGSYHVREYCVQYRETDFNFVSRLMEEEGIYYYFKHSANGHTMVIGDSPQSHVDIPGDSSLPYDELKGGGRDEPRIYDWEKTQQWSSGKNTLWDYCFEVPTNHLSAEQPVLDSVAVGKVTHKLKVAGNDQFEIYDYPGGYAKRYEGGSGDVSNAFSDSRRAAKTGMEGIESSQFLIRGQSNVYALVAGHRFTLDHHFNADGQYVLTSVTHSAAEGGFSSGDEQEAEDHYSNLFTCTPIALPYRPARISLKPHVRGCQTAVVVGPSGEEIYTDKYGRVKVQFHWDREGNFDADSSCWVRVASFWAGNQWGAVHIPRIGQEAIVDFLEGDPDHPIVVGSVYNADNMPPYELPANKTQSGIKSRSSKNGGAANYNEIRLEDKKGAEEILIHAEWDLKTEVENDETRTVGHDRTTTIQHDDSLTVGHDRTATIANNDSESVGASQTITISSDQSVTIGGSKTESIGQSKTENIGGSESRTVGGSRTTTLAAGETLTVGGVVSITAGGSVTITAPTVVIDAAMVQVAGVLQCTTLIAAAGVVSPAYSPGAGNLI